MSALFVHESRNAVLLAALQAAAFADRWSADFIASLLTQPGVVAAVAETEAGQGMILVRSVREEAEILTLAVATAARRAGLGRALVQWGAKMASASGATTMFLEVGSENLAAQMLYAGLGFGRTGLRPGYYERPMGGREDALILSAALPLSAG